MIKYFRRNHQSFIVLIVFYCLLIILSNYILFSKGYKLEEIFNSSILFCFFKLPILANGTSIALAILAFISLLFIGFYLVRISVNYLIIQKRTQFPALFVIILSSFAFQKGIFSMAIIGAIFLLIALDRLIGSMEKQELNYRYIDSGMLLALGSMFYINLLFFIPFLWISQGIIRKVNIREIFFVIIGIIIPYLYLLTGAYLFNYPIPAIIKQMFQSVISHSNYNYSWPLLVSLGVYSFFIIIASFFAIMKFSTKKIQSRKLYQLLFYLFLNGIAVFFLIPSAGFELFFIISIPASVLYTIYFTECKTNIFNATIFAILLVVPLALIASQFIYS